MRSIGLNLNYIGQAQYPLLFDGQIITMGMDPDLDRCTEMALRDMITLVSVRLGISHAEAYMLCSLAGDLRITQTVNGCKGVHMMMAKVHLD